jgi:hypothetical protein
VKQFEFLIPLFERYKNILDASSTLDLPEQDKCGKIHLMNLCNEAVAGINEQTMAYGKLCRWLGFIQGVMITSGLITVDGERDFTRPIFKEYEL